jgi:PAS domain S-box-containing protein
VSDLSQQQLSQPWYRKRQLLLAFPISCLVATLAAFTWLQVKTTEVENRVRLTQQVRLEAQQLLLNLVNAETRMRGFAITQQPEFVGDFQESIDNIPVNLATLRQQVKDNPAQTQKLQQIQSDVQQRISLLEINFNLALSRPDDLLTLPEFLGRLRQGKQTMERVRANLRQFLAEEERLQIDRDRKLAEQRQLTWVFILLAGVIGIGGSLLVMYFLKCLEQQLAEREHSLKQSAERLQTLNRSLCIISECNQVLVRATDETALLREICQVIVELGGYRGVWVGYAQADASQAIEPVMQVGLDDPFLQSLQMTWADTKRGRAVAGTAIRTGKICISENVAQDINYQPWHDLFRRYGLATAIALPLSSHDQPFGALTIFAAAPTPFDAEQIKLLTGLANDLSYGIIALRTRLEQQQGKAEILRLNQELAQRAQESETRYQQIVELAEEGIWVVDRHACTTYINQAVTRMLGYEESEILGRPIAEFMATPEEGWAASPVGIQNQSLATKREVKLRTKQAREVWTYFATSPVLDENGNLLWSCALVYNITDRKQAEEQLRLSTERISLANAELARAARLKDEFLAGMSHELRTPLNAILGLSEALLEEVYGDLTEKQIQSLTTIEQSGKHLLDLINDILDLSKIESGRMELQLSPTSIRDLCEYSLSFVRQQARQKDIRLSSQILGEPGEILVDDRRLRQVLINLLSNAVKFTLEGGSIELRVQTYPDNETIQFSVIDTGIGIAPDDIQKLFQPFVQLDSSLSRRYAGTGLGLALVRRIVEMHGGSVAVESQVDRGSCFTITLPWQNDDRASSAVIAAATAELPLPQIQQALIIEDSEAAANQIGRYLGELGTKAVVYPQGEGALEAALQLHPDVIILDILLLHSSGWEVLEKLKQNPTTQAIPVIVVSVMDERSRGIQLGAADYLLKPMSRQQLNQSLRRVFASTTPAAAPDLSAPSLPVDAPLILLAEDNEANISTLTDYLQMHGAQIILARNGLEAVHMAQQHQPNLILMDIQMPGMDGLEATRRIRAEPQLAHIPIVALTALAMPGDRERCLAAGAVAYLIKPVSLKPLMKTLSEHLPTLNPEG